MTRLIQMDPERQRAADVAREMFAAGASRNDVRLRVHRECPGVGKAARLWTMCRLMFLVSPCVVVNAIKKAR